MSTANGVPQGARVSRAQPQPGGGRCGGGRVDPAWASVLPASESATGSGPIPASPSADAGADAGVAPGRSVIGAVLAGPVGFSAGAGDCAKALECVGVEGTAGGGALGARVLGATTGSS